jgi:hypothetical protein
MVHTFENPPLVSVPVRGEKRPGSPDQNWNKMPVAEKRNRFFTLRRGVTSVKRKTHEGKLLNWHMYNFGGEV